MQYKTLKLRYKERIMVIQAILIIPFLRVLTPSIFLIHWECLSLLIFSSCRTAQSLFLASCLLPGPTWCSRPRRHLTWALIAVTDRSLLIWATTMASSWSDLPSGLPSDRTWNLSLALARISTRLWTSWLASPKAPVPWCHQTHPAPSWLGLSVFCLY